jgi:hypothetical protein
VSDRAWRLLLLGLTLGGLLAFLALRAAGLELGRAAGAVAVFLAALLPGAVLIGAVSSASRPPLPLWLQVALVFSLAAAIAATIIHVRGPGGDEVVDTDRAGRILTR